jgi:ClpP class serine protease
MSLKLPAFSLTGIWAIAEEAAYHRASLEISPIQELKIKAEDVTPEYYTGPQVVIDDNEDPEESDQEQINIAVIAKRGPIPQYGDGSATQLSTVIRAYADDPSTAVIVLDLNTPGGEIYGTQTWREAIIYARTMKPVIGFCEDGYVQSAGEWGWSACTERYAGNVLCMFGSIGMMATLMDDSKALAENGIEQIIIYAPQSKLKNKTVRDALNGNTEAYEKRLEFSCNKMIADVASDLGESLTSDEWNTGASFYAEDAQRIGLIDGIMTRADVMARALELAQNQNQNTMFKKFKKLADLAGKGAEAVTAEAVEAINAEIESEKIEGISVVLDKDLEVIDQKVTALELEVTTAKSSLTDLQGKITAKETEIADLKTKLAAKPAAANTDTAAVNDAPPADAANKEKIEASILTDVDKQAADYAKAMGWKK